MLLTRIVREISFSSFGKRAVRGTGRYQGYIGCQDDRTWCQGGIIDFRAGNPFS